MKANYRENLRYRIAGADGFIDGLYQFPHPKIRDYIFHCLVSTLGGWDHVSVTIRDKSDKTPNGIKIGINRSPYWPEMCYVKDFFFERDEVVIQFHPAAEEYVSMHPYCLHLWRAQDQVQPTPDPFFVGVNLNKQI